MTDLADPVTGIEPKLTGSQRRALRRANGARSQKEKEIAAREKKLERFFQVVDQFEDSSKVAQMRTAEMKDRLVSSAAAKRSRKAAKRISEVSARNGLTGSVESPVGSNTANTVST